jgi:hypothetical protein
MSSEEEKPRGFAVTDRRSFTDEGERRDEPQADEPTAEEEFASNVKTVETPAPPPEAAEPPSRREAAGPRAGRLPPVDFPTFVLSLGSSALMHLGEAPHPVSGNTDQNLPMAKHTIDILSMLQEKTKGNLAPPEDELLENLLYDLRLRYVEVSKK